MRNVSQFAKFFNVYFQLKKKKRTTEFSLTEILDWGSWSDWSDCDATCGGGERIRSRNCINGEAGDPGCEGDGIEREACNAQNCPAGKLIT